MMNKIDVYYGAIIVGHGLCFYDGENILTDIVSLTGNILPEAWYNIQIVDDAQLVVYSETVQ